jgi:hypothetical protein
VTKKAETALPVPLLLGVRMTARRLRRAVLGAASIPALIGSRIPASQVLQAETA